MRKLPIVLALAIAALALNAAVASAAKVRNGGFEDDLRGWTQNSDPDGHWLSLAGIPITETDLMAPKRGDRQAVVTQGSTGVHILSQTVKLKGKRQRHRLSMWVQYNNAADRFASPDSLRMSALRAVPAKFADHARGGPSDTANQQLRIEVLRAKAPIRTTNRRKILATVLRTMPGDPLSIPWTRFSVNLSKYAGKKVKLRIAEADSLLFLEAGIDAVKVTSKKRRSGGKKGK